MVVSRPRLTRSCLPVLPVSRNSRRSVSLPITPGLRDIRITLAQGYEDAIENLKIQFGAISEQKAEVERTLEPLLAEYTKLKDEMNESEDRRQDHVVNPSGGVLHY